MLIGMDGKRVKIQRPYTLEQAVSLFNEHCFYLYDVKVVDEGTLVDLFGPVCIEILDMLRNCQPQNNMKSEKPACGIYGSNIVADSYFRAVNLAGFGEVVSIINEKIVLDNYQHTGGAIVSRVLMEREEEAKRKKEEAKAKRQARAAQKKATDG